MRLIEITRNADAKKVYVNPQKICFICPCYGRATSVIQFSGNDENHIEVIESVDEIVRMVCDSYAKNHGKRCKCGDYECDKFCIEEGADE